MWYGNEADGIIIIHDQSALQEIMPILMLISLTLVTNFEGLSMFYIIKMKWHCKVNGNRT